ncbi:MAG: hypothetical protein PWP57_1058 [Candidatus Atribacteria bacterium]|nr:hypothetical protein [Candidatus Atribacteria bacterium]
MKKLLLTLMLTFLVGWVCLCSVALAATEFRGVWIDVRSIPLTEDGIRNMVRQVHSANFNALLVESFYLGQTIYPSSFLASQGLASQMSTFQEAGIDPLKIIVEEAHHLSLQVHVWFDMFYVGLNEPGALLSRYPQWSAINRDGSTGYQQGNNRFFWICPAHSGVREFYSQLLREVGENYPIDGVHLDYLRFPDPTLADTCYAPEHCQKFKEKYGIDPREISPWSQADLYREWNTIRAQSLTDFVAYISGELHHSLPHLIFSCAVKPQGFPEELNPRSLQDWPRWAELGLFDVFIPMTYSSRPPEFKGLLLWINTFLPSSAPFYSGIWGVNLSDYSIAREITIAREAKSQGVSIFAYPYLSGETLNFLSAGPFQEKVAPPTIEELAAPRELPPQVKPLSYYQESARQITALYTDTPIVSDGILEKSWDSAHWQTDFTLITGEGKATEETRVALLYDSQNLYIAFLFEKDPSEVVSSVTQRDGPAFYDDSVEIFLDPGKSKSFYYQLVTNLASAQYDGSSLQGAAWNANWKVGVSPKDHLYSLEIAIPFSEIGGEPPSPGEEWGINFYRNNLKSEEFSAWSPTPGVYAVPSLFGTVEFS